MGVRLAVRGGCELFGGAIGVKDKEFGIEEESDGMLKLFSGMEVLLYWE